MSSLTKKNAGAYDNSNTTKPRDITYSDAKGHDRVNDMFTDTMSKDSPIINDLHPTTSIGGGSTPVLRDINSNSSHGPGKSPKNLFTRSGRGWFNKP